MSPKGPNIGQKTRAGFSLKSAQFYVLTSGGVHLKWWSFDARGESLCIGLRAPAPQRRELYSAELKGPRQLFRAPPEIFDFEPHLGLKLGQTKPKISGTVPTTWDERFWADFGVFRRRRSETFKL